METLTKTPVIIYAESTPNPSSMKFVANRMLIHDGASAQYLSGNETKGSPLSAKLFSFPFVKSVFINSNYITVTKTDSVAWEEITLELRDFLRNYIADGGIVVNELPKIETAVDNTFEKKTIVYSEHVAPQTETETRIVEILEQYIRPAVEQDGGLITFKSYQEGIVTVVLKGACSGCPSSSLTLKAGIEGLLKRMIPEVKEVVSEAL